MKMVVSRYINNSSKVFGCFLDVSKAFDRVDHDLLFQKLEKRGQPPAVLSFSLTGTQHKECVYSGAMKTSPGALLCLMAYDKVEYYLPFFLQYIIWIV